MDPYLRIPHRPQEGMCPVNGIRDMVQWRTGQDWSNEFVWGLGQGGGFAYLRINPADPPRQVYTGIATPRQHRYLAELLCADFVELENRAFKTAWAKAQQELALGRPPILGPLDMFHLHYYPGLYRQRHIPIHFFLLVGCDCDTAYVLDTGMQEVQAVPLEDLRLAWDTSVPGLGKRNRLAVFDVPLALPPVESLIRRSIADQCQTMLNPPVSMLGIPAMKKIAREIAGWPEELGVEVAARCLRQVREYLNSPPDLEGDHLTAGRDRYATFLEEAGGMTGIDFSEAIGHLRESISIIPALARAIERNELEEAGARFGQVAAAETRAFQTLHELVGG